MTETRCITVSVNGSWAEAEVQPRQTLAGLLRDELGLTGTHLGCEHGACGACNVLLDGVSVRSCLVFAVQVDGAEVTTVEGLADGERLHPLQTAFQEHHALQCGFCTPGFLIAAHELLRDRDRDVAELGDDEIRVALGGNLCRCTGYGTIVAAVRAAAGATA